MLSALLFALVLQQTPPGAPIVWSEPAPIEADKAETNPAPSLPDWALADPFAWERSQCSPLVRKEASMELCQARVRSELQANLGDRLPPALAPEALPGGCAPTEAAGGGYEVQCGPQRRADSTIAPPPQVCENRPQRQGSGGVAWTEVCRPADGRESEDGLKIKLFGD